MRICLLSVLLLIATPTFAHVGSPDVYFEGNAGPYRLFVTIRPPDVIPGVAQIEIRSASSDLREVLITPLRITGPGADLAPTPDLARRSEGNPQFFTGNLWLMLRGSWQVRLQVDGALGKGELAVPVAAVAKHSLPMQRALGVFLFLLMLVLAIGLISIVGAAAREAKLEPGMNPLPAQHTRARLLMSVTAVLILAILYLGNKWWSAEAAQNARVAYKLPQVSAQLESNGRLLLRLQNPNDVGWFEPVKLDDLIPDHGHLMHLFLVRLPEMDRFWHLHPGQVDKGVFAQQLPTLPAGHYQIYADIVHSTGFPETMVAEVELPEMVGNPLIGDDCTAAGPPLSQAGRDRTVAQLSDGGRMIWQRDGSPLMAGRPTQFRFLVEDKNGQPVQDLELYMGMPGHAQFIRTDRSVFAHVHPSGTVSMAALALAQAKLSSNAADPHAGHSAHDGTEKTSSLPAEVSFLYGFPQAGDYRLFVQIKRAGRVETGVFDARVEK